MIAQARLLRLLLFGSLTMMTIKMLYKALLMTMTMILNTELMTTMTMIMWKLVSWGKLGEGLPWV